MKNYQNLLLAGLYFVTGVSVGSNFVGGKSTIQEINCSNLNQDTISDLYIVTGNNVVGLDTTYFVGQEDGSFKNLTDFKESEIERIAQELDSSYNITQ